MQYFKKYFKDVENWDSLEVPVRCPFHNDTSPSASINTDKNLFHCWVCNIGFNEEQFVSKLNGISTTDALKLLDEYSLDDDWSINEANLWADVKFLERVKDLGLSENIINEFKLGEIKLENSNKKMLGIPVYYNNILVDIRRYNLLKYDDVKKLIGNSGAESGWIIPYDKFINSNEPCYFFEGEKDMLMAREQGLNAYTLTCGAGATPNKKVISSFKDKDIILCYDNDDAGKKGMNSVYLKIKDLVKSAKYIKIGDVVREEKEDFYDYIKKYNGDIFEFYSLEQHDFDVEDTEEDKKITVKEAIDSNQLRKTLKSVVVVASEFSDVYSVPTVVTINKKEETGGKNEVMFEGESRKWFLERKNLVQLLELIEVNAKDIEIRNKLLSFIGIPATERNIEISCKEQKTIYKTTVVDKDVDSGNVQSLDLYSFDRLDVGGQYIIEYVIYPHPTKNQKTVGICFNSIMIHDNRNYTLNKEKLKIFKKEGTIKERLDYLYDSAKHHISKHLDFDLWLMSDLVFNSILDFDYDGLMRGCLDVFILGDTQVGKSETNNRLVKLYNFGHFLSLKTSTTVGLIGGSSKVDGSFCNTIGAIPRQHKRLAVLEEFSGARADFIKTMTDIRSSNELRLARVSGELRVPCKLRMITISNPINDDNGTPRFISTFPNGVMPLMELIRSAEDVARYDGFMLVPKVEKRFNPFEMSLQGEPIPKENYQHKINWVATRQPQNVIFEDGVKSYIWEKSEYLNSIFECNFPVFGVTTSKKLARFCVALASLLFNVDSSFENIIVTKEIVDYMCDCLIKNYSSKFFKLDEYAKEYKSYSECSTKDIQELQELYSSNSTLFNFLNSQSKTTRTNLATISGIENNKFYIIFNKLASLKFIRLSMDNVYPTDKFRRAYNLIDKNFVTDTGSLIDKFKSSTYINDLGE